MTLNYNHYSDKDIAVAFDCYDKKDTLKELGFSWVAEKKEWHAPLNEQLHKSLVAAGIKPSRIIDHTKTKREI